MTEYISATPEPPTPAKARPSAVWFAVGGLLVVAGVIAGIVLFIRIFDTGIFSVDAHIPPDSQPHAVTVGTDGDRFLWEPQYGSADCTIRSTDSGASITVEPVNGSFTREINSDAWQALGTFDPGNGRITVTCSQAAGPAEIGPALDVGGFVGGIVLAIVVPLLLVGLGLAVLITVGVMWATRPKRT